MEATLARTTDPELKGKQTCVNVTQKNTCFAKLLGSSEIPLWGLGVTRDVYHVISRLERNANTSWGTQVSAPQSPLWAAPPLPHGQVCCSARPAHRGIRSLCAVA